MSSDLEKKIAAHLFAEFNHRRGRLVPVQGQSRRHYAENIIAFGLMCIEIGRSLEHDELRDCLKGFLEDRDQQLTTEASDAKQSAEDEHGIEQHLSSP
jgi:hypothetical protein